MTKLLRLTAVLALLSLVLAACGSDEEEESASTPEAATTQEAATAEATETPAEETSSDLKDTETKPAIAKPSGDPPAELEIEDIVKGEGKTAKAGDNVTVHYVGVSFSTGQEFDASWDRGAPFPFALGQGQVIPGWDEGVAGMKVGGRRQLTIPPDMAYGEQGSPPAIGPNETLIFVVDLLEVE